MHGQIAKLLARPSLRGIDLNLMSCRFGKKRGKCRQILLIQIKRKQNARGELGTAAVMLEYEGDQRLVVKDLVTAEYQLVFIHQCAATHVKHGHCGTVIILVKAEHVLGGVGIRHHLLSLGKLLQSEQAVTMHRSSLEALLACRPFHLLADRKLRLAAVAAQDLRRKSNELGILLLAHLTRARGAALSELMVKARAFLADITRETAVTGGQAQRFLQRVQHAPRHRRARIGAEIPPLVALSRTRKLQTRIGLGRDFNIRIGLRVLQANVVFGRMLLDQRVLQRQRLDLGVTQEILKIRYVCHHFFRLIALEAVLEILGNAVFELARLTHVDHATVSVLHDIHAGGQRQLVCLLQKLPSFFFGLHAASFPGHTKRGAQLR